MLASPLVQNHQGIAVPVDLQLVEQPQRIDQLLHNHPLPVFLPEYLVDIGLQNSLLHFIRADAGHDLKLPERQFFFVELIIFSGLC